jgi:hypothetical protein
LPLERSAWRPFQLTASKQVQMHMKYRLPRVTVAIQNQTIALLRKAAIPGDLRGREKKVTDSRRIRRAEIIHRRDVLQRNEEQVSGGLWANVFETKNMLVAVNDCRGKTAVPYLAECAAGHWASS